MPEAAFQLARAVALIQLPVLIKILGIYSKQLHTRSDMQARQSNIQTLTMHGHEFLQLRP
jgi:hypothetical protein